MDIVFATTKLSEVCNSSSLLKKRYGLPKAKKIQQRLYELAAADTLAVVSHLPPPRCHALKGSRAGQFSVDTVHPYRLIFEPANDPVPLLEDSSVDRSQVTAIRILEIDVDYHG
jgi:toxin HigB-1